MKVSVLVPVFNGEKFLAECLESILSQDMGDYELLISDNASTDGTPEIIDRYARQDPRISWWRNPANVGLMGNFRLCLQKARGEQIKFMCADDKFIGTSALGKMSACLSRNQSVTLVSSASLVIGAQSQTLATRRHFERDLIIDGRRAIILCFEEKQNLVGEPSGALFRRSQAGHWFHGRCRQLADLEQWFVLLDSGDWGYLAESLFAFRQHPDQESERNNRQGVSAAEELWLIQEWFSKSWLQQQATPRMLHAQIRHLRDDLGAGTEEVVTHLSRRLGWFWRATFWLKEKVPWLLGKITRPPQKLFRHLVLYWRMAWGRNDGSSP